MISFELSYLSLFHQIVDVLTARLSKGNYEELCDIILLLKDLCPFPTWIKEAKSHTDEQAQASLLEKCVAEGHPTRLREAMWIFEEIGFTMLTEKARAQLPQVAKDYLTKCLDDSSDMQNLQQLHAAIFEAEDVGLSQQAAEARTDPRLVNTFISIL